MSAKFTPGPWRVENKPGSGIQIIAPVNLGKDAEKEFLQPIYELRIQPSLAVGTDGTAYATLSYESWRQFPSVNFKEMQLANAKLIAAAPQLLEVLQEIVKDNEICLFPGTVSKAFKAIQLATE